MAAVFVVGVALGAWLLVGGDTEEPTIPLTGADIDADAREAFTIVASAFEAYNAGDMDTWALWREGGAMTGADFASSRLPASSWR